MNNAYVVEQSYKAQIDDGKGTESLLGVREQQSTYQLNPLSMAKMAGITFLFTGSSVTAIEDPWLTEKKQRDAVLTMSSMYQKLLGRPITWAEAIQMARAIGEKAERERLEFTAYEASQGIQYDL